MVIFVVIRNTENNHFWRLYLKMTISLLFKTTCTNNLHSNIMSKGLQNDKDQQLL